MSSQLLNCYDKTA